MMSERRDFCFPDPPLKGSTGASVYRHTEQGPLRAHAWSHRRWARTQCSNRCLFGGGWAHGTPDQWTPFAHAFAEHGVALWAVEYRVKRLVGESFSRWMAIEDAHAALTWVQQRADEVGLAHDRVLAMGGSAGGHLAACTALVPPHPMSHVPQAAPPAGLILLNPVVDTGPSGYGYHSDHGSENEAWSPQAH